MFTYQKTSFKIANKISDLIWYNDAVLRVKEIPLWGADRIWSSYFHKDNSYSGEMTSLCWIMAQDCEI